MTIDKYFLLSLSLIFTSILLKTSRKWRYVSSIVMILFPHKQARLTPTLFQPGKSYEIRFFAEKGAVKSTAVSFRLDMPDQPAAECTDPETNQVYQVGQVGFTFVLFYWIFR